MAAANKGGTHGPFKRMRIDGESVDVPLEERGISGKPDRHTE